MLIIIKYELKLCVSKCNKSFQFQVLSAVGVWLQQMGCSSTQSFNLVESIIQDHFFLNTSNQATLRSLATTVPQFIANFTTSVTELYMQDGEGDIKMPPKNLLEAITSWVRLVLFFENIKK